MTTTTYATGASRNGATPGHCTQAHQDTLTRDSAIDLDVLNERGYFTEINVTALKALGFSGDQLIVPTLILPVWGVSGQIVTYQSRPDAPRLGKHGRPIKYENPAGMRMVLDVHPRVRPHIGDPSVPLWIVEGIRKADSAVSRGMDAIALLGVFNWRGKNAMGGKTALACWNAIAVNGRPIGIIFDSDARHKREVLYEVVRLAEFLESRDAAVKIVLLPDGPNGAKHGLDDFFAHGGTVQDLRNHIVDCAELAHRARPLLVEHPDTGEPLVLPAGYDWRDGAIARLDQRSHAWPVYTGLIYPRATGSDLGTGEESVTIAWASQDGTPGALTVPRAVLTDTREVGKLVGGAGAALHPNNTRDVAAMLVETIEANRAALPRQVYASRLGVVGDGVILPAGSIGFSEPVQYAGRPAVRVGTDADVYSDAIRLALGWQNVAAFWLIFAMGLASPAIARLRPRRNPVIYNAGASGSGKTTIAQFATGCYGDPTRAPFKTEAARTTIAGALQTFDILGGLPHLVDDAHMSRDQRQLEGTLYAFANGQTYTKGSIDGKARGGTELAGTLLLTGEATPELRHAGAQLRVLYTDAGTYYPLGVAAQSDEGAVRAAELEHAWLHGAGLFGYMATERIWGSWSQFKNDVYALEAHSALGPLLAWRQPLAIGAAALCVALDVAGITMPDRATWLNGLLAEWAAMLMSGRCDHDPSTEAWENLMALLATGAMRHDGDPLMHAGMKWYWFELRGEMIACRKDGDDYWRVPTTTPQFKERAGTSAVQLYGQTWIKRGWIVPSKDGQATAPDRVLNNAQVRVLHIPESVLSTWSL